uniref:fructokinase n=1 Tax=Araucaria cunninghamii TaxID=56994 RepID=A0A0D6R894_ARACU
METASAGYNTTDLVVCFGEILVEFTPTVSGLKLRETPAFEKAAGGAPANVAVAVAKLGGNSAFLGKVGDDPFGHMLGHVLEEYGVNIEGLRYHRGVRTALSFVTLSDDGERDFIFYRHPSADMLLEESELDVHLIQKASIFHFGSISFITEPCKSAQLAAMKIAKEAGALLSYDPNLRLPLWPSPDEALKSILTLWDKADVIKVSDSEVSFLTNGGDSKDDEVVMKLWRPNLKLLLVTAGEKPCRYFTKNFRGSVKNIKVHAIDTTAAGDAFVGAVLKLLVNDKSMIQNESKLIDALKFANTCGAITTTRRGAIPALPNETEVMNLLQ